MTRTYTETVQGFASAAWTALKNDGYYLPEVLANVPDVQDKTRKFILQFTSNTDVADQFKNAGNIFSLMQLPNSIQEVWNNGVAGLKKAKPLSKVFFLVAQSTEALMTLNNLELISIKKIRDFAGSVSVFKPLLETDYNFASLTEKMNLFKNSFVLASTSFSLVENYAKWEVLEYDDNGMSNESFTQIVSAVSNVFKFAVVGLNVLSSTTNLKNLTVETRFGKVSLSATIKVLGYFSTTTSLFKSIHEAGNKANPKADAPKKLKTDEDDKVQIDEELGSQPNPTNLVEEVVESEDKT